MLQTAVLNICFSWSLLATPCSGAAEPPATSEASTPDRQGSGDSDDQPGALGTSEGSAGEPDGPGGPGGFGAPGGPGGSGGEPGYELLWYPAASVSGQGAELALARNRLTVEVPVRSKDAQAVMLGVSVDQSHFSGKALLPSSGKAFPSDLWKIQVGLKHMRQFANGSSRMLMFDIESASDQPFETSREMNFTLGGFYLKPAKNGRDSWTLGVIYSPLGWPNFPIPLVSYNWTPSDKFQLRIGLPFAMTWRSTDKLTVDMALSPGGIDGIATYKWSERSHAYGGYQRISDQYFLVGRAEKEDAFFSIEQRLIVGFRRDLWQGGRLDLTGGYAFDRHFGVGDDERDLRDRMNLDSGIFLGAKLIFEF